MYRALDTLDSYVITIPGATDFLREAPTAVDWLEIFETIILQQVEYFQVYDGLRIDLYLAIEELTIPVPGLEIASITVGANVSGYTFLHGSLIFGSTNRFSLYNLLFSLRLEQEWLVPVALEPDTTVAENFEIQLRGSFDIDSQFNINARMNSFSIPPFMIGRTGIILALQDCQLALSDQTPGAVLSMGYNNSFRGLYAGSADFQWLAPLTVNDLPGIRLHIEEIALSQYGVSFHLTQTWLVDHDTQQFADTTELLGHLITEDWQIALAQVQVSVFNNIPDEFNIKGFLKIPYLDHILTCYFGIKERKSDGIFQTTFAIHKVTDDPETFNLGIATFTLRQIGVNGLLAEDQFLLQGFIGGQLDFPLLSLEVDHADITIGHTPQGDEWQIQLFGIPFGPLGEVESAIFRYRNLPQSTGQNIYLETTLSWKDISQRLNLDNLPDQFPTLPDDGQVTAQISWQEDSLALTFSMEVTNLDNLWPFIPEASSPEIRRARFVFAALYDTADDLNQSNSDPHSPIQGSNDSQVSIALEFSLRLPDLPEYPGLDLIQISTGDEEGWVDARLDVVGTTQGQKSVSMGIKHAVSIDINLPGIPQPHPPIHVDIIEIGVSTLLTDQTTSGRFDLSGNFDLHPLLTSGEFIPVPMRPFLQNFLPSDAFSGTTHMILKFDNDQAAVWLDCTFSPDMIIELDLFDMIYNMARGIPAPSDIASADDIDLDLNIRFRLKGIGLQIGSLSSEPSASQFSFKFLIGFHMTGIPLLADGQPREVDIAFELSDQHLSLGFDTFAILLSVPKFPITPNHLIRIEGTDGLWQWSLWLAEQERLDGEIKNLKQQSELTGEQEEMLTHLQIEKFMLQNIFAIYDRLNINEGLYQAQVETIITAMTAVTGALHIDTSLAFELRDVKFVIPFDNPQGIRVEGGAGFIGLHADDPLKPLESLTFNLGLSAEYIFFSIEGGGDPIPLTNFGIERYSGGSINLKEMRIGYGYSKNSFSFAFAGKLELPKTLRQDLDTSQKIGFGLLPPTHTRLAFKIDLIPVVLGPIDFILPLFDFNLDMRRPMSQGLLDPVTCTPDWDGLELILPGIIHTDMKRIAFSPVYGMLPIPNYLYDYDYDVGNDLLGYTFIADNMLVLLPMIGVYSLPFLTDGLSPFMDNLCVDIRLAGFGVHFNLQRPLPTFSPLILFEVLGLLSDPTMPIEPNGPLANTVRATIQNAAIRFPGWLSHMFPEATKPLTRELNYSINLGTLITITQTMIGTLTAVSEIVGNTTIATLDEINTLIQNIQLNPPEINPSALLALLPPNLRRFELDGSFGGFSTSAIFLLLTPDEVAEEFVRRDQPSSTSTSSTTNASWQLGDPVTKENTQALQPALPAHMPPLYNPDDPENQLLQGHIFSQFSAQDVEDLPLPTEGTMGVVVGADVKLFESQIYQFLGYTFSDGTFALVTGLDIEPLNLSVAGIHVALPLAIHGRFSLTGQAKGAYSYAAIQATGWGHWEPIPELFNLRVGNEAQPTELTLHSNGRFQLKGDLSARLFNSLAYIQGQVDISESHCFISGRMTYHLPLPLLHLDIMVDGRIGPNAQFRLAGSGTLQIQGKTISNVKAIISERGIALEAALDTGSWGTIPLNQFTINLRGTLDISQPSLPDFLLEGESYLRLFGTARPGTAVEIQGKGGIKGGRKDETITTFIEGSLSWQGMEWLNGRVELSSSTVKLLGRTRFIVDLTPESVGNINMAHLTLRADLAGEFNLSARGGLGKCNLDVNWELAITLPGIENQTLPIAMQAMHIDYTPPPARPGQRRATTTIIAQLLRFDTAFFIPTNEFVLPLPQVDINEYTNYYWYLKDITPDDGVTYRRISTSNSGTNVKKLIDIPTAVGPDGTSNATTRIRNLLKSLGIDPGDAAWQGVSFRLPKYSVTARTSIYLKDGNISLPDIFAPDITTSSSIAGKDEDEYLFRVPTDIDLSFSDDESYLPFQDLDIAISLAWNNQELGLLVTSSGTRNFLSFSDLLSSE